MCKPTVTLSAIARFLVPRFAVIANFLANSLRINIISEVALRTRIVYWTFTVTICILACIVVCAISGRTVAGCVVIIGNRAYNNTFSTLNLISPVTSCTIAWSLVPWLTVVTYFWTGTICIKGISKVACSAKTIDYSLTVFIWTSLIIRVISICLVVSVISVCLIVGNSSVECA